MPRAPVGYPDAMAGDDRDRQELQHQGNVVFWVTITVGILIVVATVVAGALL